MACLLPGKVNDKPNSTPTPPKYLVLVIISKYKREKPQNNRESYNANICKSDWYKVISEILKENDLEL